VKLFRAMGLNPTNSWQWTKVDGFRNRIVVAVSDGSLVGGVAGTYGGRLADCRQCSSDVGISRACAVGIGTSCGGFAVVEQSGESSSRISRLRGTQVSGTSTPCSNAKSWSKGRSLTEQAGEVSVGDSSLARPDFVSSFGMSSDNPFETRSFTESFQFFESHRWCLYETRQTMCSEE
jgi:hypothetical protein